MVNETGKVTGIPQGGEEENFDSYEKLLDQYGARKFAEGEVMKGTVLIRQRFASDFLRLLERIKPFLKRTIEKQVGKHSHRSDRQKADGDEIDE